MRILENVVCGALLFLVATPGPCATLTVTIRAPLDGEINAIAAVGDARTAGSISPAYYEFNSLRKQANAAGAKLRTRELPSAPRPEVIAANDVVKLTSHVLELQLVQQKVLLRVAGRKLIAARAALKSETDVSADVDAARKSDDRAAQLSVEAATANYLAGRLLSVSDAPDYKAKADDARLHNQNVSKARRAFLLTNDLPARIEAAEEEYNAAAAAVAVVNATLLLGDIGCPTKCKVVSVHAMVGQWVTKGDPLVDVEIDQ